jgi:hypothetical protein
MPYPLDTIPVSATGGPHPLLMLVFALWSVYALSLLAPGLGECLRDAWRARRSPWAWLLAAGIAAAVRVGGFKPPLPPEVQEQRAIRMYYREQGARYIPLDGTIRQAWEVRP